MMPTNPPARTARVRYAPSPTGSVHVGNAHTALFNYLFSRRHQGRFVYRLEDTDRSREVAGAADTQMAQLRLLGITWDEGPDVGGPYGPYRQSERSQRYQEALDRVEASGRGYRCYCSAERLAAMRAEQAQAGRPPRYDGRCRHLSSGERAVHANDPYVLRLAVPEIGETVVSDLIRGDVHFQHSELDDFVIQKSDGTPLYNFGVVVDDHEMAITHVIRGDEHLANTPKQLLLYDALGWKPPVFAHIPMLLAADRAKLSKRHGATALVDFLEQGILPEALVNYLGLLGFSPPDGREMLDLDELCQVFDLTRVQRSAAVYDPKKLEWLNTQYLKGWPAARVADRVRPVLAARGILPDAPPEAPPTIDFVAAVDMVRERAHTLVDLAAGLAFLYAPITTYDPAGAAKHFGPGAAERLRDLAAALEETSDWSHDALEARYSELAEAWHVSRGALIHPTRLAITGTTVGPSLFACLAALGPALVVPRLHSAAAWILQEHSEPEA
ncbi:MAG: glutamate--tRNA ligase [Thermaerobacter sp.]|nr:glutamate--tRNA ligase [Thermaerobacter sp.]